MCGPETDMKSIVEFERLKREHGKEKKLELRRQQKQNTEIIKKL